MPQYVEYNGEVIEFPDDMSDDEIVAVLKAQEAPTPEQPTTPAPTPAPMPTPTPVQPAQEQPDVTDPEAALVGQEAGKDTGGFNLFNFLTGADKKTDITEAAPDWTELPEAQNFDWTSFKTALGTMAASPEEIAQIVKSNYPGVEVSKDEKGNFLLKSSVDGKIYAIKPGFRVSDIPRALGTALSFTPAGRAEGLLAQAAGAAGTQAGIEATQALTGGEFNPAEVVTQGVLAPIAPAAGKLVRGAKAAFQAPVKEAVEDVAQAGTEQIAQTAKQASGILSGPATERLAAQAAPDPKVLEAANRLGIVDNLQPDHVSSNGAYVEFAQALKSIPGSEARQAELKGLEEVTKRATGVIDELGGTQDFSRLNESVRARMKADIINLEKKANEAYTKLNTQIPGRTSTPVNTTMAYLQKQIDDLGGVEYLSKMERELYEAFTKGEPSYALVNQFRENVGMAARSKGPFSDANTGTAKYLYKLLTEDQGAAAAKAGLGQEWSLAKQLVSVRKGVEDDATALFGKNLDSSMLNQADKAMKELSRGDSDKLSKFISAVPQDMRQNVVASSLASAFGKSARGGNFNFTTYTKWYEGVLKNKESYKTLLKNLPPESQVLLKDLYRVSRGISRATGERIQTGRINVIKEQLQGVDGLISSIFNSFSKVAGVGPNGIAAGALSAVSRVASKDSLKAADDVIKSPEFLRIVSGASKGETSPALVKALAVSDAFKRFGKTVLNTTDRTALERFINQSIQTSAAMDRTEF